MIPAFINVQKLGLFNTYFAYHSGIGGSVRRNSAAAVLSLRSRGVGKAAVVTEPCRSPLLPKRVRPSGGPPGNRWRVHFFMGSWK